MEQPASLRHGPRQPQEDKEVYFFGQNNHPSCTDPSACHIC
jgi:hypothetical protein